jgi:hypothetical protein
MLRPRRNSRPDAGSLLSEQRETLAYTRRWHHVHDWAVDVVTGMDDVTPANQPHNARLTLLRGALVYDLQDDEEAYERGIDLVDLYVPPGPRREDGGYRRVIIRVLTWIPDDYGRIGYDAQWIVTGQGHTAHAATMRHRRFALAYAHAVDKGIESRRLICTGIEVLWWTASQSSETV